jgi:hypothetical protein
MREEKGLQSGGEKSVGDDLCLYYPFEGEGVHGAAKPDAVIRRYTGQAHGKASVA